MAAIIDDSRYRASTQFQLWSFSKAKLRDLRTKSNSIAKAHIASRLAGEAEGEIEFLSVDEEEQLLKFFIVELLRAATFCELPAEIRATAAVFMRRFYITNSVMMYPPTNLLKTCLFFGAKTEGHYTRLSKFSEKFPNTTPEEIVAGEFLLCQGIRFAFDVRHPFRALEGVVLELHRAYPEEDMRIQEAHIRARDILKFSPLITDAYFHYTPSQIMFAALAIADQELVDRMFDIIQSAAGPGPNKTADDHEAMKEKIYSTITACQALLETEMPERMDQFWGTPDCNKMLRPLQKKLRKCRDPDRIDLVKLQKARREQSQKMEEDEKAREAKRRKVGALEDPFGPPLR
ncbi:hypothetical protein TD95_003513 [Thielaviopsis punctulata]|uniref:Cyclin-like domain-containing protein n=1 Tax=Thielaviopsis punctulata TaxID=72032 RepID=A0A0F4Z744_9PEZI|nr:hypothetical protein TD95_003513 [Thielaviopsis punctulata]